MQAPLKFALRVLAWLVPAAVLWFGLTPFYNVFLKIGANNLLNLTESPNVTQLVTADKDDNYVYILRSDFPPAKSRVTSVRVTDVHFHLVLLAALFLAVPGLAWKQRLANLGWAALITVFFDVVLLFFWVKFVYATQLGEWSLANYGAFARNFWGLGKHILDLPFKLGLPLALWAGFYLRLIFPKAR